MVAITGNGPAAAGAGSCATAAPPASIIATTTAERILIISPISSDGSPDPHYRALPPRPQPRTPVLPRLATRGDEAGSLQRLDLVGQTTGVVGLAGHRRGAVVVLHQIGRASCRERG